MLVLKASALLFLLNLKSFYMVANGKILLNHVMAFYMIDIRKLSERAFQKIKRQKNL